MEYTQREKELLAALVSTAKALGRLIDETQHSKKNAMYYRHPELAVFEMAFEVVGNHSNENLF
jgi:hypothetical protein